MGRACQVQSHGSSHPPRAGHGQVPGGGQQADSTPGSSAGQGTPELCALLAPYIGPRRPPPASDGRAAAVPQGPRSFGEEVHVTLSPPCVVRAQEAAAAAAPAQFRGPIHVAEIKRSSHTMAWTESAKSSGRVGEGGNRWTRGGDGAETGKEKERLAREKG